MSARRDSGRGELQSEQLHGLAWCLAEIDSDTLPEDGNPWPEVRRRLAAYRDDRPGWRTGEIEQTLEAFEPGGQA